MAFHLIFRGESFHINPLIMALPSDLFGIYTLKSLFLIFFIACHGTTRQANLRGHYIPGVQGQ